MNKEKNIITEKFEHINVIDPFEQNNRILFELYTKGLYKDAEKLALSNIESFPSHLFSWKVLGALFTKTGKKSEALNANRKCIQLAPKDPEGYINTGVNLLDLEKLEEAELCFNFAISIDNSYADAHYNLGLVQKNLGRLKESIISYNKAISLKRENFKSYGNLANSQFELGRLKETIKSLVKAIEINPNYVKAWNNVYFPLKITDTLKNYSDMNIFSSLKKKTFKLNNIRFSILEYKLNEGGKNSKYFFKKALNIISKRKNFNLKNTQILKTSKKSVVTLPKKIISLLHFGRSGTGLLHSLIDNHAPHDYQNLLQAHQREC